MHAYESLPEIEEKLFDEKILSHDLCLLEYNAQALQPTDIDAYLRALHQRMASHGILAALFCSGEKAILYIHVKSS